VLKSSFVARNFQIKVLTCEFVVYNRINIKTEQVNTCYSREIPKFFLKKRTKQLSGERIVNEPSTQKANPLTPEKAITNS